MAGRRAVYLACLAGAVAFYTFYQQWLAWLALLILLFLPWFSLLVSLPAIRRFRATADHPATVPMGQQAQAALRDQCPLPPPEFRGKLRVTRVMTGEVIHCKRSAELPTDHCGKLLIEPVKCRVYDYLGLFRFRVRDMAPGTMLVRPAPVPMEKVPDLSRYLARSWRPKPGGGFGENHELRLYRPGDSLQQIHWKLTAKTGKLILRETVEPEEGLVLLKLDLNGAPEVLDEKLGKLLWLSEYLLDQGLKHQIHALTGDGFLDWPVQSKPDIQAAIDHLLGCAPLKEGTIRDRMESASWEFYIGGGPDEP